MTKKLSTAVAAAALAAAPVQTALADDFQAWTAFFANGPIAEDSAGDGRLLVWFDGHARFSDDASRLGTSILRPGLGWRLNDSVSLWGGYGRVVSDRGPGPDAKENRFWQQATYQLGQGLGGALSGRTRIEQRRLNLGDDTGWRLRQLVRYARPLGETPYSAIAWNETFIAFNDTDWGAASGYDQSRNFAGLGYRLTDNLQVEGGYMLNHIRRENAPDAFNHVLSVSLSLGL